MTFNEMIKLLKSIGHKFELDNDPDASEWSITDYTADVTFWFENKLGKSEAFIVDISNDR